MVSLITGPPIVIFTSKGLDGSGFYEYAISSSVRVCMHMIVSLQSVEHCFIAIGIPGIVYTENVVTSTCHVIQT